MFECEWESTHECAIYYEGYEFGLFLCTDHEWCVTFFYNDEWHELGGLYESINDACAAIYNSIIGVDRWMTGRSFYQYDAYGMPNVFERCYNVTSRSWVMYQSWC